MMACSEMASSFDRMTLFPEHRGLDVFPNTPIFSKLLRHVYKDRIAIRDLNLAIERSYGQLLSDTLSLRRTLQGCLSMEILQKIDKGEEIYVGVLAHRGYEFAVAMLAILALGAAAVPMGMRSFYLTYFANGFHDSTRSSTSRSCLLCIKISLSGNLECFGFEPVGRLCCRVCKQGGEDESEKY